MPCAALRSVNAANGNTLSLGINAYRQHAAYLTELPLWFDSSIGVLGQDAIGTQAAAFDGKEEPVSGRIGCLSQHYKLSRRRQT